MIRFNCENCGQHYEVDESLAGNKAECSNCDAVFYIPEKSQEPDPIASDEIAPEVPETPVDPEPVEKKNPSLNLSASLEKKARKTEDAESVPEKPAGTCPNCGAALKSADVVICIECGHNLKLGMNVNTVKKAKLAGKLGLAVFVGAAAALLSGIIWAAIAVWTKMEIGWIACLVGLITGIAVCLVTPERSARMGVLAVLLATVGMLTGKLLTAEYFIRDSARSLTEMAGNLSKLDKNAAKQFQDMALMGLLAEEMLDNGEIKDSSAELAKLAPKKGETESKEYQEASQKALAQSQQNIEAVKSKFKKLSSADKARLKKKLERLPLLLPLKDEMIANGEIPKPDERLEKLAPKSFDEEPSEEYLEAMQKNMAQEMESMKKVRQKLYALSDEEAERLKDELGSTFASRISYWDKLKMVTSWWDVLWYLLAVSTAWGLGNGTSSLSRQEP